ncbi:ABC transporter substrate-binding protein [Oceanispirochaeta sp. M2]|uniref:ABC transporter substrate-binding protein n=1 Tax=Oceanispirochaeta sp. M2 TaxID=2735869 RepID=UPI0015556E47|nr:ABC transporter substrate-binding protein [Oceanispirochaeta sp. M2]MBF9018237.1 ABC transporter substrate-binding protein [Oceanispirochaeta sp. M2]
MKKSCLIAMILFVAMILPTALFAAGNVEVDESADVNIEFWHAMSGERVELIQGIVDKFMAENPNIKVDVQYTGSYNDTLNKVKSAYKAGNAPDIFHSYEIGTLGLINSGIISPLDEIAGKFNRKIPWDDFFTPVQSYYKYKGVHYSMPFNSSTPLIFYNKTFFAKAGLDPENPPKTYSEIREAAVALQAAGYKTPLTWNLHSWYFEQMICLQDEPFVNEKNGRSGELPTESVFNGEAGQKVLEWWVGLEKDGLFLDVGPGWSNHRAAFGSGEVALTMSSSSDVNTLTAALKEKGWEMGTGYIPRPEGAKGGVAIGGGSLWLTNSHTTEEELAALKLITFISEDEAQIAWHKGTGYFPVRKTAMDQLESEGWFDENPNFLTAFNQLLDSPETLNTAGGLLGIFPEARELIQSAIQEMYAGKPVKEALDEAAAKVNASMTEWNEVIQ